MYIERKDVVPNKGTRHNSCDYDLTGVTDDI